MRSSALKAIGILSGILLMSGGLWFFQLSQAEESETVIFTPEEKEPTYHAILKSGIAPALPPITNSRPTFNT